MIYPPVDVERFNFCGDKDNYYLTASRLVPYKRIDLIVEAFSKMPDKRLVVIGDGSEMDKIKSKAGKNIEILGYQPNNVMEDYMKKAKAFVFAAEEDFGITPVEAQACGTPVIAFGKGGVLETIRPLGSTRATGLFFNEQKVESLITAVTEFEQEANEFDPESCRENALRFSNERFTREIEDFINQKWKLFSDSKHIEY
ncbi:GDP-mannose-dependent alpha-(1-6)-phosphatidylinositol monomannoside mannosyltransferase [Raoultella terrigena]|uniref:GDP-mannose-dependent alpha-(1-6)-phosphatidylinositol monomannoside mannosyltransferase n=1 Tax=Raoultella terrigena TaxID=577 RepID=A0A4U9CYF5_RAOTE|nr:GDP-mannose-dependent alpha-(1-6)-phosphatidylinositol monomannoside mannosyltransferase [Raoultella terrigena]